MKYESLVSGKEDFAMIGRYLALNHTLEDYVHKNTLDTLEENMSNALLLDTENLPEDIIHIYSKITVSCESTWSETFQIVPPEEEDIRKDKISVINTLGASVIGLSEGDHIKYGLPGDIMKLKIIKVEQSKKQVEVDIAQDLFEKSIPKHYKNSLTLNT